MPGKKKKSKRSSQSVYKKQVKTRVSVNVRQSGGGGGVSMIPYWHPPVSNYVPTTTPLMSMVTSPLTPGNVGDINLANQIGSLQRSIDSMARAFPPSAASSGESAHPAASSTAPAATQAAPAMADADMQAAPAMADAEMQATERAAVADGETQVEPRGRKRDRYHRVDDVNPRPHKRRRIDGERAARVGGGGG